MTFQYVLASLLADNEGASGALFLDDTGETVELACAGEEPEDLRVLGAYLGIYLRQLEQLVAGGGMGETRVIHIERGWLNVYVAPMPDGYHLALVQTRPGLTAQARRTLERAARQLQDELFPA